MSYEIYEDSEGNMTGFTIKFGETRKLDPDCEHEWDMSITFDEYCVKCGGEKEGR